MGDRREQGSPNYGSPERGAGAGRGRGVPQDPQQSPPRGVNYGTQGQQSPPRGGAPQRMDLDPNFGTGREPPPEVMQTMLDHIPSVPNPQAYLARPGPISLQMNDYLSSGERIQEESSRRHHGNPNRDPDEVMHGNMRQAMHASRLDSAMRAHADRLEAIGIPQPDPNARSPTGAFAPGPVSPGARVPRRDTPAPWVHVQSLPHREPQAQELSRSPAQLLQERPAPQLPAGDAAAGEALVSPEVAAALHDLKDHLLDERGHFRPTALASAYRAGIINENDQIRPTFVGWVQLAGIPCFVRADGIAYLGHEITGQPSSSEAQGSPPQQYNQSPPRSAEAGEHPVLQLRAMPTLAAGISVSSTTVPPDVATKLEALRRELLHAGTDNFREEGIADLRRFGVLNELDQVSPPFIPWLKAAEIPIVFDADQKAYLGVYDGRSARTTGLGREWASWNRIAMESRTGIEQRASFLAAEQLLRLPAPAENIDLARLSPIVARKVQGLKNGILDASGQFNPQKIAELHRMGIINEIGHILPHFVPWLRAAEIPLVHDAERQGTRLDSDAARGANYGRRNYRADESPQTQARLTTLVDGAAQVQASTPAPSPDQRTEPILSEAQRAAEAGNPGLMHPIAAEQLDRIVNQFWADPGQQAGGGADSMEVDEEQISMRIGENRPSEQESSLFGPDGDRDPAQCPQASDPDAKERAVTAIRQGIQRDDKRMRRLSRDLFGLAGRGGVVARRAQPREQPLEPPPAGAGRGGVMAARARPREQDFEPPPARRQRVGDPEPAAGRVRAREDDFDPPPAQRQRLGGPELAANRANAEEHNALLAMIDETMDALDLEEQEKANADLLLGFGAGNQEPQAPARDYGDDGGPRSRAPHAPAFRNRLRKTIAHYKEGAAVNRVPPLARKQMGEDYAGMVCEMWPDDHSPIPMHILTKVLNIKKQITDGPAYQILDEHVQRSYRVNLPGGGTQTIICDYMDQDQVGCQCWKSRLGEMWRDQRQPNLFKRAIAAVVTSHIRFSMPLVDEQPQQWRWSREHNDLFYSWLHHYGEENAHGKQYNCVLPMRRLLEFRYGSGLDYPGIAKKLSDWAAAVTGWQQGTSYILLLEEQMQYHALQEKFSVIGVWLEKHPEVSKAAQVSAQTMRGWLALARSQGENNVDLDMVVEDYVTRQRLVRERDSFLEYIKQEKEHFVLRSLQEINYEILWDERYPREHLDLPYFVDVSTANNMPDGAFYSDGRGEGLTERLFRPDGDENWPPGVPRMPDITVLGFD